MDAHIILPPAPPRSRPTAQPSLDHPLRPFLSLPPGATRILILSNIRRHFPLDQLNITAGDFLLHLNHAIHAPETLPLPGTHHALIIRHNTKTGPYLHWFSAPTLDGFAQILPIHDPTILPLCSWFKQYRALTKKSPTTGFIAANICRELSTPASPSSSSASIPHTTTEPRAGTATIGPPKPTGTTPATSTSSPPFNLLIYPANFPFSPYFSSQIVNLAHPTITPSFHPS